ncbi:MAG: metal transporter [Chloroflexota bacterium]|nr:metal transporter [Chloroflexota bacterium]
MTEQSLTSERPVVAHPDRVVTRGPMVLWAMIPLLLLAAVLVVIVRTNAGLGPNTLPPIETLSVQSVRLPAPGQIELTVVNDGPDPITIAQVLVDEAYWQFTIAPGGGLDRLQTATVSIPYPWVEGETHGISMLSSTGVVFEAEVPVAVESPRADGESFLRFGLVGIYVGVIPVALGLLWYPFLRRLGQRGMSFVLALTIGLLAFLAVDMWEAAHEVALAAASALDAVVLIPLLALLTAAFLSVVSHAIRRATSRAAGLPLAYNIAFGIGLHNLGEGLAIGAAFALGEAALGVFLILGFTLHNVTEGIGIAAPLVQDCPRLAHFAGLAAVAGGPAILGTWIGAFVYSPFWTTIFLAVGIGAILQVIVEIGRMIWRGQQRTREPLLTWTTLGGVTAGIVVMYVTALLVTA